MNIKNNNLQGILGVWLFINGHWALFSIDEYFPTTRGVRGPDLAFSRTLENELWVIALEKAYAKAYGSYFDITGGDPVHALRDLTGAPYDRIEDYSDLAKAWAKLKEANAHEYVLTCFTKSAEEVEQKSGDGLVSGHAYSILDVREIVDARGKVRMILQIRNPWGKFEWTGEFSDDSNLWTPQLKQQLKVVKADDGIFWMPFEKFVQFYEGIGILKVKLGHLNNSVVVKRDDQSNKSIIRLTVYEQTSSVTVSIDQIDSRIVDNQNYNYSYFRVTIARIEGKDKIEFIDTVLSPERNIFLEDNFKKGDYLILVEAYWNGNYAKEYGVGTYADSQVELEVLNVDQSLYNSAERLIWQSFAIKNKSKLKPSRNRNPQQGNLQVQLEVLSLQDQNYGVNVYAIYNTSSNIAVHDTYKIITIEGYDVVAQTVSRGKAELIINPKDVDILLFKMNPLNQKFALSHQVLSEELINKSFQKDTRTIELLSSLGGSKPTANDKDPFIESRESKQAQNLNYSKMNEENEKARKKLIEDSKGKIQEKMQNMTNFWKDQKNLLISYAQTNNTSKQYIDPKTNNVDPFFVISESFKDIPMRQGANPAPVQYISNPQTEEKYGYQFYGASNGNTKNQDPKKGCDIF